MSRGKLKDHIWFIEFMKIFIWCSILGDTTFWSHVTLIQPWKFIQGQISWGKLIVHRWLLFVFLINYGQNVLSLSNIAHWKPNDLDFALSISSKVKCYTCYKVNWKAIYDLLYVFHTNFDHMMHHLWDTTPWKVCNLDLTYKGNPRSKITRSTERSYMTLYMCFIQTLVTTCTVSEILA